MTIGHWLIQPASLKISSKKISLKIRISVLATFEGPGQDPGVGRQVDCCQSADSMLYSEAEKQYST